MCAPLCQWLSLSLCLLVLLLSLFGMRSPVSARSAEWSLYQDTIYYSITAENQVVIKSARASITQADIPAEIDGYPVTEIESYAFKDCSRLTQVTLPDTIRKIGAFAFKDDTRLTELYIPDTVSEIGWGAVQGTGWLLNQTDDFVVAGANILLAYQGTDADVVVPDGVQAICGYAFESCMTMQTVTLPASLKTIGAFSFLNCKNLMYVQMEEGVETIGEYAFHFCTSLQQITIPDSVTQLDSHAFEYCKSLTQVHLGTGITQLASCLFRECVSLAEIQLPDTITRINNYVFQDCTSLTDVTLPVSVTELGLSVFDGCTALERLTILNASCALYDSETTISPTALLLSKENSTAALYAEKYGREFLATDRRKGDVDGDGFLTAQDAYLILCHYADGAVGKSCDCTLTQQYAADMNEDTAIDATDAYDVLVLYAKLAVGINLETGS